jgi:hypothetical protein
MYFKVHLDGRKGNLQSMLVLECEENCKIVDW